MFRSESSISLIEHLVVARRRYPSLEKNESHSLLKSMYRCHDSISAAQILIVLAFIYNLIPVALENTSFRGKHLSTQIHLLGKPREFSCPSNINIKEKGL